MARRYQARTGSKKVPLFFSVELVVVNIDHNHPRLGHTRITGMKQIHPGHPDLAIMDYPSELVRNVRLGDDMTVWCVFQTKGTG